MVGDEVRRMIGPEVHRLRKKRGWTQAHLAMRTELREATICDIEKGKVTPRLPTIELIAAAFGVTVSVLLIVDDGS